MVRPYDMDLRERVVRFVEEGRSRHAAAAHFEEAAGWDAGGGGIAFWDPGPPSSGRVERRR